MVPRLNIVGCGKVGRSIGRLWFEAGIFQPAAILNREVESARRAAAFLGGGTPVSSFDALPEADVTWIAASDDALTTIAGRIAAESPVRPGSIAFHVSGALASSVLDPIAGVGARVASVHPLRSFADPALASLEFAGTWCGVEGDPGGLAVLVPAFEAIGGRIFPIETGAKTLYHASAVFASNYLVALVETAIRSGQAAGIDRETARRILGPLIRGTLDNIDRLGTAGALTGPIARGDARFVAIQERAVHDRDPRIAQLYRDLGRVTVELARERGSASTAALDAVEAALADRSG